MQIFVQLISYHNDTLPYLRRLCLSTNAHDPIAEYQDSDEVTYTRTCNMLQYAHQCKQELYQNSKSLGKSNHLKKQDESEQDKLAIHQPPHTHNSP